ncbi:MAG: hypothetical protein V4694_06435 [Pseudomonadota bacterium]
MKKFLSITTIAVLFSQVSFAETNRTIYTSPTIYTSRPSTVASPASDSSTTTETKTETKVKKITKVEVSNSGSRTEGSYAGIDVFGTRTTLNVTNGYVPGVCAGQDCVYAEKPALSNNSYGVGLTYKYAFNFDKFFIAPGIFLEQNNHQAVSGTDGDLKRLHIKNRYGIRSDFGYDIGRFAPYLTIGYAEVAYKSRSGGYDIDDNRVSVIKNGVNGNVFYGAGLKVNLTSSLSLNTEYNFQRFAPKTTLSPLTQDYAVKEAFRARMDTVKVGLYYKF